jgi:hypothetical protein
VSALFFCFDVWFLDPEVVAEGEWFSLLAFFAAPFALSFGFFLGAGFEGGVGPFSCSKRY